MNSPRKRKPMGGKAYIITALGGFFLASYVISSDGFSNKASRAEIASILLTGEMPQYWSAVEENAPDLFENTVSRLYQNQRNLTTETDVIAVVNDQIASIYISLTGRFMGSLTDIQRREVLNSYAQLLIGAQDYPAVCSDIALTGGQNLTNSDLRLISSHWDAFNAQIVVSLTQAQYNDVNLARPPEETSPQDYEILISEAAQYGLTRESYRALLDADAGHPDFCDANISVYTALTLLDGGAGNRLRHDETNLLLIGG